MDKQKVKEAVDLQRALDAATEHGGIQPRWEEALSAYRELDADERALYDRLVTTYEPGG